MKKVEKKSGWILIFLTESAETSIISEQDIYKVLKPASVKQGWIGDLPWLEDGLIELFEAKIIRISKNKKYLLSLIVDTSGRVQKKKNSPHIELQLNLIKMNRKRSKESKKQSNTASDEKILSLPNINHFSDDENFAEVEDAVLEVMKNPSSTDTMEKSCPNCEKCICRDWAALVTPEIAAVIVTIAEALKEKRDPGSALLRKDDVMVELCPKTNIPLREADKKWIRAKSKKNPRAYIINTVLCMVSSEELLTYETAKSFQDNFNPNLKKAVLHFTSEETGKIVDSTLFTDVINKYMQHQRKKQPNSSLKKRKIETAISISPVTGKKIKKHGPPASSTQPATSSSTQQPILLPSQPPAASPTRSPATSPSQPPATSPTQLSASSSTQPPL